MKLGQHLFILLAGLLLLLIFCCKPMAKREQTKNKNNDTIEINSSQLSNKKKLSSFMTISNVRSESGFISLDLCNTTHKYLHVKVSADKTEAKIFFDNELLQIINDKEGLVSEVEGVWYMDANFDGYTDIFIGTEEPRNHNALLLWNPTEEQFQRLGSFGKPGLHGFMIHTPTKSVIEGGFGLNGGGLTRSKWRGYSLNTIESLDIINFTEDYEGNNINIPFTVRDAKGTVIVESYSQALLSKEWQAILKATGFNQENIFLGIDIIRKFCREDPHQAKKNFQGEYCIIGIISSISDDAKTFHLVNKNGDTRDFFSITCKLTKKSKIIANSNRGEEVQVFGRFTEFNSNYAIFEVKDVEEITYIN